MNKIYVVGIGPGNEWQMTNQAIHVLENSDVIIGYPVYLQLLGDRFAHKEIYSTPMRQEKERCILCVEKAKEGKTVSLVCSGDAGIYGLASLLFEVCETEEDIEVEVIPGITAASSGAALLGAPLNHDFCVISLSDLLTPWEQIEKRLVAAAEGDFAIAIYNPGSHKRVDHLRRACEILLQYLPKNRPCGYVENIGREGTRITLCSLEELKTKNVNMFTTVFVGNSTTKVVREKLVTKRGYQI